MVLSPAALLTESGLWYDEVFQQCVGAPPEEPQQLVSGNNSVVECDLAKVEVAGSNPVSRSIY